MLPTHDEQFEKMNRLSAEGKPFLFITDFIGKNVEILTPKEIQTKGLLIDFEGFKTEYSQDTKTENFKFESLPESVEDYKTGFENVQQHIRKGNSYLANYTRKTEIKTTFSLEEVFKISKAKYKLYYPEKFLFFSPETFIQIIDNKIFTHPMKGTADASEENALENLRSNIKEKAEHYTVVDLLRNDLSMVADDVQVDEFQRIDLIKTNRKNLYAMSSKISGSLKAEFRGKIGCIIKQLLPAGSILGAPKKKTELIIRESEGYERGYYTGICGWYDGRNLDSCVMIRFIEKENDRLFFRSGGGITHMSKLEEEYQEMKNKIYVPIY